MRQNERERACVCGREREKEIECMCVVVSERRESGRGARSIVVLLYGVKWTGNFLLKKAFGLSE